MTFTSRIPRVWVLLLWNGPVGLSFICKRLLIVESLDIIGCDCRFFLNTMYMLVCTGIELLQISESPLLSFWLWTVCQTSPVQEPCVIHIEVKSLVEEILVCTWQLVLSSRVGTG